MQDEATRHGGRQGGHGHHQAEHHQARQYHHEGGRDHGGRQHHEGGHDHGGGRHNHEGTPSDHRGGHHFRGGGGGPGRDHFGGPRGRARRGEARYVLLDALRDGPKHGYEIIKALEERSAGRYAPSPGTVYPTMQLLEDQGLVRADQEAERRVYALTEAGQADLTAHAEEVADFWARFAGPVGDNADSPELGFLQEELESLSRTVRGGLRDMQDREDQEPVRRMRQAVEQCRQEIRAIIAGAKTDEIKF